MVDVCFYFQVHQPFRLRKYSVFEIGKSRGYFDKRKNRGIMERVARKCYLPTNKLMLNLLKKHPKFRISYSFSGVVLEQFETYTPDVLKSFKKLIDTGRVEIFDETYYHTLSFLYSIKEFREQVKMHNALIKDIFGYKPRVFRNTELVYSNDLAHEIEDMGYKAILAEGIDHILGWRSPNFLYRPKGAKKIKLLLKNYRLSDDIAFRFSTRSWKGWPLTAPKYARWISRHNGNGEFVNLFMDYETFGEHQWVETGIFDFLKHLPEEILKHPDNGFATPSEIIKKYRVRDEIDVPHITSWADIERDTSAWLGNKMQKNAISSLYRLEEKVKSVNDENLVKDWRLLQISDHFYYMCTKWFSDGDVHKYFNPYNTPHDAFITYMNILTDLKMRLNQGKKLVKPVIKVGGARK